MGIHIHMQNFIAFEQHTTASIYFIWNQASFADQSLKNNKFKTSFVSLNQSNSI